MRVGECYKRPARAVGECYKRPARAVGECYKRPGKAVGVKRTALVDELCGHGSTTNEPHDDGSNNKEPMMMGIAKKAHENRGQIKST
eukprot:1156248-Pelagomonas_calceolata.AAC.14